MMIFSTETDCSPLDAWSTFTAVSLHFNAERDFDAFKFKFKGPRCKRETFMAHKHRLKFEKLAKLYPKRNDIILYSVANIIAGNTWIGDCKQETYDQWQAKIQAVEYNFKNDISTLHQEAENQNLTFDLCIEPKMHRDIPLIYSLYRENRINLETLAILQNMLNYVPKLNRKLSDPLEISKTTSHLVGKYAPFLVPKMNFAKYTEEILLLFTNPTK